RRSVQEFRGGNSLSCERHARSAQRDPFSRRSRAEYLRRKTTALGQCVTRRRPSCLLGARQHLYEAVAERRAATFDQSKQSLRVFPKFFARRQGNYFRYLD